MNILISISFIGEKGGGAFSGIHEADMCGFNLNMSTEFDFSCAG